MWNYICTCILAHQSKPHGDESRPELLLNLTLSSLAVSVLHIDPLPPPDAAHSPLGSMAAHFFSTLGPQHLAQLAFLQSRNIFNQACPHDHLRWRQNQLGKSVRSKCNLCVVWISICRFMVQGLKISYEHCKGSSLRTFNTDVSLNQMEFLECLFPSEGFSGDFQRDIQYTEVWVSVFRPKLNFETAWVSLEDGDSVITIVSLFQIPAPDIWHGSEPWCSAAHLPSPAVQTEREERPSGKVCFTITVQHKL